MAVRAVPGSRRLHRLRASFAALGAEVAFAFHGGFRTLLFASPGKVLRHRNLDPSLLVSYLPQEILPPLDVAFVLNALRRETVHHAQDASIWARSDEVEAGFYAGRRSTSPVQSWPGRCWTAGRVTFEIIRITPAQERRVREETGRSENSFSRLYKSSSLDDIINTTEYHRYYRKSPTLPITTNYDPVSPRGAVASQGTFTGQPEAKTELTSDDTRSQVTVSMSAIFERVCR